MTLSTFFRAGLLGMLALLVVIGIGETIIPAPAFGAAQNDYRPHYVAIGDSITTGSSIATCQESRQRSPWGCVESLPAAIPYPDRIAQAMRWSFSNRPNDYQPVSFNPKLDLYRAGIWGYTASEAAQADLLGHTALGGWLPQLTAATKATWLVTGSLGINDLQFSDIAKWAGLYLRPGGDFVTPEANSIIAAHSVDFDRMFAALKTARDRGARVDVTLYYNPYDSPGKLCADLKIIGDRVVNALDSELARRAIDNRLSVTDFRPAFVGHGSGSDKPFVFGSKCKVNDAVLSVLPAWMGGGGGKASLAKSFDPHPNNFGTAAMAALVLGEVGSAD